MEQHAPSEVQEIDLENWSARHPDQPPPQCRRYRIRIDREQFVVHVSEMTGREILELADKKPAECHALYQKRRGGENKRVALDETVDFRRPGIERFKTLPIDAKDGSER